MLACVAADEAECCLDVQLFAFSADEASTFPSDMAPSSSIAAEAQESQDETVPGEVAMTTGEEEEAGEEEYRCEMCDTVFQSLTQFMDHRNYDCTAGKKVFPCSGNFGEIPVYQFSMIKWAAGARTISGLGRHRAASGMAWLFKIPAFLENFRPHI